MMAFKLVFTGLLLIHHYRHALAKALWLPILCSFAVNLVVYLIDYSFITAWISLTLSTFIYSICAISIHRILILGAEHAPEWRQQGWTLRESVFTAALVAIPISIWLVVVGPLSLAEKAAGAGSTLAPIAIVITAIALLFLMMRLLLLLPMIALDGQPDIANAWQLGKKYPFSIPLSIILATVLVSLPGTLISLVPGGAYAAVLINEIVFIVDIAVLSAGMRLVMGGEKS